MNKTLSLCMIVKNEEDTLSNCLNSVSGIFDEIIIVDTGSTDKTVDIARGYTDKIYNYQWRYDFADARNYSFSKSASDYIMWLDADDVLLPRDAEKLKRLKSVLDGVITEIAAKYNVGFDENGNVTLEYYRERIFLNNGGFKWSGRIHETIPLIEGCLFADFAVTHNKIHPTERGRNLAIFEKMIADGEVLDERNTFYYARELYYNERIDEAAEIFESFIDLDGGFVENKIDACLLLADCYRIKGEDRLSVLLRSFEFDAPRAEICCEIGKYFYEKGRNKEAICWYENALNKTPDSKNGSFVKRDCYGFIPLLQLCVLYYAEGNIEKAELCNEKAAAIKPTDAAVLYNKEFFSKLK